MTGACRTGGWWLAGGVLMLAGQRLPAADAISGSLEEVVVTAERRPEPAHRAALALTALTGEQLAAQGINGTEALNGAAPNLAISSNGQGSVEIGLRGIGSTNNSETGDPAVAFNLDGVYLARARSAVGLFYDLQRIEVLRGPQGTLYGRNATAGSINVISNRPTQQYQGSALVEVGSFELLRVAGVLNLPLSSQLAMRGAFQTQSHQGYADNAPLSADYQDEDAAAGRLHLLWTPNESSSYLLTGDYFRGGGVGPMLSPLGSATAVNGSAAFRYPVSHAGRNEQRNYGVTLTADWQLSVGNLTYIGSWRRDDAELIYGMVDAVGGNHAGSGLDNVLYCNALTAAGCSQLNYFADQRAHSHELRLAGSSAALGWVAGLYSFSERERVLFQATSVGLAFDQPRTFSRSQAAFGQLTYTLAQDWRVTAGLRATRDQKGRAGTTRYGTTLVGDQAVGGVVLGSNDADYRWHHSDWKLGLEHDLTATSLLYASVATGYKAGGYNDGPSTINSGTGRPENSPYGPEEVTSVELGWKQRSADQRAEISVAAFHYDYRDFQVSAIGEVLGQPSLVTVNAQQARVWGIETENSYLLTPVDRLDISVSYLHARYRDFRLSGDLFHPAQVTGSAVLFCTLPGDTVPSCANYSGNRLAKAPDWSANIGYEHSWRPSSGAQWTLRLQSRFASDHNLDYHNFALTEQSAYTRSDLSLRYDEADRRWGAMIYVRNLEDDEVLTFATPRAMSPASRTSGSGVYAPPRTWGLQLSARF